MQLKEFGFWDYTCPGNGSLEQYSSDDWDELLDDMVAGGFTSFVLCVKWITTGYRSRYPWLDQSPEVTAIGSDNAVIYHALEGMRRRGIRVWLLVVGNAFDVATFGIDPVGWNGDGMGGSTSYDLDQPGVAERILLLFDEITELFGEYAEGMIVELEFCDRDAPHRVPLYDAWARANGRPSYAQIKNIVLEPRSYPFTDWRDFSTTQRIHMMRHIETVVRARGFRGTMASLVEMENATGAVVMNTNLGLLRDAFPEWPIVSYDSIYDRRVNRLATMDFCIKEPQRLGLQACYLTRGVMTFTWPLDGPPAMDLEEQWRMAIEDAVQHQPDILWFMGADARLPGMVCNNVKLPAWGFADGRVARRRLMTMCREAGLKQAHD